MGRNKGDSRVERLLDAMTLAEKIGQLTMTAAPDLATGPAGAGNLADDVRAGRVGHVLNLTGRSRIAALQRLARHETRLGIPLVFGLDVLHGYRTIFPIPLAEAASCDPGLWERTARAAAADASSDGVMLTFAPMLDVCRDPRWGRIAEGPGEDPWLASLFARAKVRGFQGRRADRLPRGRIAATAKHVGAYGAVTAGLDYAAVDISERQLREVHLPAFRAAVEEGVAAIMPAFVAMAGLPATANRALLQDEIRGRWGFDGVIISDYHAIAELMAHGVASDLAEAAALALGAGVDIDMMGRAFPQGLPVALERGLATGEQVDIAVRRVLRFKERLGLLDQGPADDGVRPARPVRPGRTRALSRLAASRSMVLLKNDKGALPLSPSGPPVYLLGPHAEDDGDQLGPWAGLGHKDPVGTVLSALRRMLPHRVVERLPAIGRGARPASPLRAGVIVLCLGETADMSGEAASRAEPVLPLVQARLARSAAALGLPMILVLWAGRPLVMNETLDRVDAALLAWFPGSEGPAAIADVLAGRCDPSGRLPVSWPASIGQIPSYFGREPSGRPFEPGDRYTLHYIDAPSTPLFPFGHGLSYAAFDMTIRAVAAGRWTGTGTLRVDVQVTNRGSRRGVGTVFLFVRDVVDRVSRPLLELRGLEKVTLAAGEARIVRFRLSAADFASLGLEPGTAPAPGEVEILAGPSADRALLDRRVVVLGPCLATR